MTFTEAYNEGKDERAQLDHEHREGLHSDCFVVACYQCHLDDPISSLAWYQSHPATHCGCDVGKGETCEVCGDGGPGR